MRIHLMTGLISIALFSAPVSADQVTFQGVQLNATEAERTEFLTTYENLAKPKALAMSLSTNGDWALGWAGEAGGVLPAIGGALQGCERARASKQLATPCDLVRVNDEEVELGLALRKRLDVEDGTAPTMLWRFRRADTTVYVGGTLHGFKGSLYPLPIAFEQAYAAASELIFEVNLANVTPQQIYALQQKYAMLPAGQTLEDVLPADSLAQVMELVAEMGVPWNALNQLTPAALSTELTQALMMTQGLLPNYGFEQHFLARAMQEGKTVDELETLEFQLELLSRMPIDLQAEDTATVVAESKTVFGAMVDAWYQADRDKIWQLIVSEGEDNPELQAFNEELFTERNHGMADKIARYLKADADVRLVLVGAGHLAGDEGIIALLEEMGFSGQQLRRDGQPLPAD